MLTAGKRRVSSKGKAIHNCPSQWLTQCDSLCLFFCAPADMIAALFYRSPWHKTKLPTRQAALDLLPHIAAPAGSAPPPSAYIKNATTTIDRFIKMVWFIPAVLDGIASGNLTFHSNCHREHPKAVAASLVVSGTSRMPSAVRRMTGGIAKVIVANTLGCFPVPKNAINGIR